MRILFAGTTYVVGGAERVFAHLVRGFRERGYDVELLALRELGPVGEELRAEGVVCHAGFTGQQRVDATLLPRLARFLRTHQYDVVYFLDHAHAVFYVTVASIGSGVRVRLMPVHTTGQWGGARSLKRPIRLVRRHLDRIISIAEAQRKYLVETEGIPDEQIVVIPNGIPIEPRTDAEVEALRREVRLEVSGRDDVKVVGITAVLRPEKNHELLLAAFAQVRKAVDAELWIVGDGPRRPELEARARELGVEGAAVRFSGSARTRVGSCGFDMAVLASHPLVETLPSPCSRRWTPALRWSPRAWVRSPRWSRTGGPDVSSSRGTRRGWRTPSARSSRTRRAPRSTRLAAQRSCGRATPWTRW
ncbi:MAG: glycosyltransferase [Candidatus Eisenbacteria bacterium]